jgi:SAM-dependent methyltransferase
VYEAVLAKLALARGSTLLDVGCGAGTFASIAAEQNLRVSGIDAASALLDIARERVPDAEFTSGEIEELPFAEGAFDAVTGFNSFQYAARPVAAVAQAKRVAKKGAPVVILTWGIPEKMPAASLVTALKPLMPPPPPNAPGPFALSEESALRSLAQDAGLTPVEVCDVNCTWHYKDLATGIRGLNSSGVARRAMDNTSEDAVAKAHEQALAPFRQGDGAYRIGAVFRYLLARA